MEITVYILWYIWKSRCAWHFKGQKWEARKIIQKATRDSTAKSSTRSKHSARDRNCEETSEVDLQGNIRINVASEKHEGFNRYGVGWTFTTNEERTFLAGSKV